MCYHWVALLAKIINIFTVCLAPPISLSFYARFPVTMKSRKYVQPIPLGVTFCSKLSWALKQHLKMSPQVGSAAPLPHSEEGKPSRWTFIHLGSVLPGFLPSFPSKIWVSDVTFVTFFGEQKTWRVTFVRMWRSRTRKYFVTFFVTSFPQNGTFWPRRYKTFWMGIYVTIRLELKHVFLLRHRFVNYLASVKREGHLG